MAHKRVGPRFVTGRRVNRNAEERGIGQVFDAEVLSLAETGNAVVEHPDGRRFFVPGAWLGERIRVRVKALKSQYGIGELVELLEPSPARREPPCGFHGFSADQCGGCAWMFADYPAQLQAKQQRVEQALQRLVPNPQVCPIVPAPEPLGYRIRAQLKTDGQALGFVANGQRQLVAVDDCLVLTDANRTTLKMLSANLSNPTWRPTGKQTWTTLDIDESISSDEVSVNKRLPFQQANRPQNEAMRAWLARRLQGLSRDLPVLELFAGSGNFTEVIAAQGFQTITAVEVVSDAITALAARRLPGVTPVTCDLFDDSAFAELLANQRNAEVLVLDPPRDGLKCRSGLFSRRSRLRDVLYISCDLATFTRDLRDFLAAGYILDELQPVDLFPQTPHVELLAHLRRPNR